MYDETTRQRSMLIKQGDEIIPIELDCYIADLIVHLNDKQFYTEYCCSGHNDDAFMGMYIKFYPMDEIYENTLRTLISAIPEFYIEEYYELSTDISISSNYIQLTDPTDLEMIMAKQIVFRKRWSDTEFIKPWISHCIIVRPVIAKDYINSYCEMGIEGCNIERNKKIILGAIDKFDSLIKSFGVFGV